MNENITCKKHKAVEDIRIEKRAIPIYLQVDWFDIAGYLPWTTSHFLRGVSDDERDILAIKVYRYIQGNGVFDVSEIGKEQQPPAGAIEDSLREFHSMGDRTR